MQSIIDKFDHQRGELMRRAVLAALFTAIVIVSLTAAALPGRQNDGPLFSPEKVKIQLTPDAYSRVNIPEEMYAPAESFGIAELDEVLRGLNYTKIIRAHRKVKDTAWEQATGFDRWFVISVPLGTDILGALKLLKASPWVEDAIPEHYAYLQFTPNDTYYPNNWGHNNTAQLPVYQGSSHSGPGVGTIGFDSNAEAAWDDSQGLGNTSVIIGILDTGADLVHPDLRLVQGYDFGDNDNNPQDNSAEQGHGTACSGISAGIGNNALGVTGIAAGCSVMPLKIADTGGNLEFTYIANAATYAGDNNVDVGSMSFGAGIAYGSNPATDNALAYAYNHGVVLFAATGNGNSSTIQYPSNHPNVISVGAASPTGQRKSTSSSDGEYWWGSNYGVTTQNAANAVDVMAPTILPATDISGTAGYSSNNYYMWFNGTSCATPYAAGVAALLLSKDPTLTPAQVKAAMTSTATDMTLDGGAGWDRYTGYGMVNAQGALAIIAPGMPSCSITAPAGGTTFELGTTITVTVNATDSDGTITRVDFHLDGGTTPIHTDNTAPYTWTWDTTGFTGGSHTIQARAYDNVNNMASSQITINLLAPANEGFESGDFSLYPWNQSGNMNWVIQNSDTFSGTYAAKSGAITHNQTSTISVLINVTSPGNVTFYQKVSSEPSYDYLYFYIDNVQMGAWAGTVAWTMRSYPVTTGNHEFKWTYSKDGAVSTGSDCAWLDHINFPPHNIPTPANIAWTPGTVLQNMPTNQMLTQTLTLSNSGSQDLNWNASVPTGAMVVLDETFTTTSIPAGWTQQYVSYTTSWAYAAGGIGANPPFAYDGTYNARLFYTGTTPRVTRLITPALDLSGTAPATLSFWHAQEVWNGNQDELRVYYRTSATGTWTLLTAYTNNIEDWVQEIISLPNLSGTYYIAFEGTARYGYGVCLDKIVVSKQVGEATPWITLNGASSAGGVITGIGTANITLGFDTTGMTGGTYNSVITITSNSAINSTVQIPVVLNAVDLSTAPVIEISDGAFDCGIVLINTTDAHSFSISNTGTANLWGSITTPAGYSVFSAAVRDAGSSKIGISDAEERNTIGYNIAPDDTEDFILIFSPTALQDYNGKISVAHNAGGDHKAIHLTGTGGKPTLAFAPLALQVTLLAGQTEIQLLNISNPGNMPLQYSLTLTGNPAWLSINGSLSATGSLAPLSGEKSYNVSFNTTGMTPGTYNAVISGTSNDPFSTVFTIPVTLYVSSRDNAPAGYIEASCVQTNGQNILSWTAPEGNVAGYYILFSANPDFSHARKLAFVPASQTSFADSMSSKRQPGFYRVVAVRD